jgi:hypothetical protein
MQIGCLYLLCTYFVSSLVSLKDCSSLPGSNETLLRDRVERFLADSLLIIGASFSNCVSGPELPVLNFRNSSSL